MGALFGKIMSVYGSDDLVLDSSSLKVREPLAREASWTPIQRANGFEDKLTARTQILACETIFRTISSHPSKIQLGFERAGIFPFNALAVLQHCSDFAVADLPPELADTPRTPPRALRSGAHEAVAAAADIILDTSISPARKLRRLGETLEASQPMFALGTFSRPASQPRAKGTPDITRTIRLLTSNAATVEELKEELDKINKEKEAALAVKKEEKEEKLRVKKAEVEQKKADKAQAREEAKLAKAETKARAREEKAASMLAAKEAKKRKEVKAKKTPKRKAGTLPRRAKPAAAVRKGAKKRRAQEI